MTLALSIFGFAFAAFSIWLTVRIVNRRERWAKRMAAVIAALPILYVASFGPACWISSKALDGEYNYDIEAKTISMFYRPLFRLALRGMFSDALVWYATLFSNDHWTIALYENGPYWGRYYIHPIELDPN